MNIITDFLGEEVLDPIIDETVNDKDVEISESEVETYESTEDLKYPPKYDSNFPIVFYFRSLQELK